MGRVSNLYYDIVYGAYSELRDVAELHVGLRTPQGGSKTYSGPKPLVSPYGPNYAMHPELSRSGIGYVASQAALPTAFFIGPLLLADMNRMVIEDAPEEQQRGLWQMFISGLTGTFGIGSGAESYVQN